MRTLDKVTTMGQRQAFALTAILALAIVIPPARSQLAITEVMSSATNRFGVNVVVPGPDYWELTNFGTNQIDLTGCRFTDRDAAYNAADSVPFQGVVIKRGESIVFYESLPGPAIPPDAFRAWWGLEAKVQVIPYTNSFGLSGGNGDSVRLWGPAATSAEDVLDAVDFGPATDGHSFTYDSITGEWGVLSMVGVDGAFRATTADDVGSPGTNTGPVGLSFTEQPVSVLANPGDSVTFSIRYRGLPRPTFQWFHNGALIPGAGSPLHTVPSAQSADEGSYYVVLSNGFQVVTSATAVLTVSTNQVPPEFIQHPEDLWVFIDQDATFRSVATGLPQPTYQWRLNGTNIVGETNRTLVIFGTHAVGTNVYSVAASNYLGAVTNSAKLLIFERPDLRITELIAKENLWTVPGDNHEDWWELTNFGTNAVDLFGYRFDDFSPYAGITQGRPQLEKAWTNTQHVIIQTNESIVFVENMTADDFRRWWGWTNLPPDLQIITYGGSGRSFSQTTSDGAAVWNMGATRDDDVVTIVKEFTLVSYSQPNAVGVSFTIDPEIPDDYCCSQLSVAGANGAFVAAHGGDIGSPGYIRTPTDPRVYSIVREPGGYRLTWRSVLPGSYTVQYRTSLTTGNWTDLGPAEGASTSYLDTSASGGSQRFYRVMWKP